MKGYNVLKNLFSKTLPEDSIILIYGSSLCKEAFSYDDTRILYLKDSFSMSLGLGLSMCTEKKIYLICSDSDLIKNLDIFTQIALSKMKNIVCIILNSGYDEDVGASSLSSNIVSLKGLLFNIGFNVHDYSHFFKKIPNKKIMRYFERLNGPFCVFIDTNKGLSNEDCSLGINALDNIKRLKKQLGE